MLKEYIQQTTSIYGLENYFKCLKDIAFKVNTNAFRFRLSSGVSFDKVLPFAFAAFKEACYRTIGLSLHDTQLLGGLALCSGKVVEMKTGEGKSLTIAAAAFVYSLFKSGVHIVVPSDQLTKRDSELTKDVFDFLGVTVGKIVTGLDNNSKRTAYNSDITYCTCSELIFDYLQDHMSYKKQKLQRRKLVYSIVDEVDSMLIDEAETPFIVSTSNSSNSSASLQTKVNKLINLFVFESRNMGLSPRKLYYSNQATKQLHLTELGFIKAEKLLVNAKFISSGESLYTPKSIHLINMLYVMLKTYKAFSKGRDYIIRNGEAIIIDKLTGRLLPNKRWTNGIHQAVEAKEGLKTRKDCHVFSQINLRSYFTTYCRLSGITGTANPDSQELKSLYNLNTITIPTSKPPGRHDEPDRTFLSVRCRIIEIIRDIQSCYKRGQPILVGTQSVEQSESLSAMLNHIGLPHEIMNAKTQMLEPIAVANAGKPNKITIASCIAGRGTDILLGGLKYFDHNTKTQSYLITKRLGGLRIIGIGRHNLRKADVQLIGRAGRQGEAGTSCFYVLLKNRESFQKRTQAKPLNQKPQLILSSILELQRTSLYKLRRKLASKTQSEAFVLKAKKWSLIFLSYYDNPPLNLNLFKGTTYLSSWFRFLVNINHLACIESSGLQKRKELEKSLVLGSMDSIWMNHLKFLNSVHWNISLNLQVFKNPRIQYFQNALKLFKRMVAYLVLDVLCLSETTDVSDVLH